MLWIKQALAMNQPQSRPAFCKTPFGVIATLLAVAASVYLYLAHKDQVLAPLPFAFFAACPLMHVFMHRGHGKGGHSHGSGNNDGSRGG